MWLLDSSNHNSSSTYMYISTLHALKYDIIYLHPKMHVVHKVLPYFTFVASYIIPAVSILHNFLKIYTPYGGANL